jgi:hypothetical protein
MGAVLLPKKGESFMAGKSLRASRAGKIRGWLVPPALALIGSAAVCAPAVAQSAPAAASAGSPTIVVSGDSVVATSLPSFGQTTVTATRPDAITGSPVVIGTFSGTGNPFTPFSVNTTTPTPFNPSGDCWQKGALSQALTPDLQPGDTITLTKAGFFGTGGSSTSHVVQPADVSGATPGPIAGCASLAPYAQNAITSAPSSIKGGAALTVSGVAQPLTTGVSVSAADGAKSTAPVTATPAADGSWTATIPTASVEALGNTNLQVTPVFAVPDASTGATADIAGVRASVNKLAADAPTPPTRPTTTTTTTTTPKPVPTKTPARVAGLHAAARVSLINARRHGIQASFIVPSGVHIVRIQLRRSGRSLYTVYVVADKAGTRQTVTLPAKLAKRLKPGPYALTVSAGASRSALGPATARTIRLTNPSHTR